MSKLRLTRDCPDGAPDWASFEAEALPHVERLFRLAMWLERDRAEAEDLVQDTLAAALESFHRFERGTNCRAWLIVIMRNLQNKRWRARGRARLVSDEEVDLAGTIPFEPSTPQTVTDTDVLRALDALPRGFQEVLLLADVQDLSYKEIAMAMDIPVGTVMSRLHRARNLMRQHLASWTNARGHSNGLRAVAKDSSA
jgi:RNA polymerase sigma-70 factor (ECF subfamily)